MSDPLDEVAEALIANELAIASPYELFAQTFEEDAEFTARGSRRLSTGSARPADESWRELLFPLDVGPVDR